MGLLIALYSSSLLCIYKLDFRPMSQCICLSFRLIWVFFLIMCGLQVSERSRVRPRYLTSDCIGSWALLIATGGHLIVRLVKVTWANLAPLTVTLQLQAKAILCQRPVGCRERWLWTVSSLRGIWGSRVLFVDIVK